MPPRLAAATLIASPLLTLVATAIAPANEDDPRAQLAVVLAHQARWYAADLTLLVSLAVLVPAVAALSARAHVRARGLALTGAALAFTGIACAAVVSGLGFVEWQMTKGSGAQRLGEMAALLDRVEGASAVAPVTIGAGLVTVGLAVLGLALWRAREAPAWPAVLLVAGAVAVDAGYELTVTPLAVAGAALNLAALGYFATRVAATRPAVPA